MLFFLLVMIWLSSISVVIYLCHFSGSYLGVTLAIFLPLILPVQSYFRFKKNYRYTLLPVFISIQGMFIANAIFERIVEKDFWGWLKGIWIGYQILGLITMVIVLVSDFILNLCLKISEQKPLEDIKQN